MSDIKSCVQKRRKQALASGKDALKWYENWCWNSFSKAASAGETVRADCHDPSLGEWIWDIPDHSAKFIDHVVGRARTAQLDWAKMPSTERSRCLFACADALQSLEGQLAVVLALETGKALNRECMTEASLARTIFRYFGGLVHEIKGKSIQAGPNLLGFTTLHPWGVVAGIIPWNMPLMFMAYKVAASLASGNTVIIKMPEQATASLVMCFRLIVQHLPEGVVSFISSTGSNAGNALVQHPGVDKISFTGSVVTGTAIYEHAARTMRSVTLELSGKSPMIILEDCDPQKAIQGIVSSMRFTRAGQSCTAASRIYVPKSQVEQYRKALGAELDALRIGDALDPETDSGPVVTLQQKLRIENYLEQARRDGLNVVSYGNVADATLFERGYFVRPHLVLDPEHTHPISQEEFFGPVATLSAYDTLDGVIGLANDTAFGLSASVWGRDISKCLRCASEFRAGIVLVNQNSIMLPGFSYGGIGESGVGK